MSANDFIYAYQPNLTGILSVKNTDGTNDIAAGDVVTFDAANPLSATNAFFCVKRANATSDSPSWIAIDAIPKTKQGRVAINGPIVGAVAGAAITAGTPVMPTTSGQLIAQTAGLQQTGYCLTTAAGINDKILVLVCAAFNH